MTWASGVLAVHWEMSMPLPPLPKMAAQRPNLSPACSLEGSPANNPHSRVTCTILSLQTNAWSDKPLIWRLVYYAILLQHQLMQSFNTKNCSLYCPRPPPPKHVLTHLQTHRHTWARSGVIPLWYITRLDNSKKKEADNVMARSRHSEPQCSC